MSRCFSDIFISPSARALGSVPACDCCRGRRENAKQEFTAHPGVGRVGCRLFQIGSVLKCFHKDYPKAMTNLIPNPPHRQEQDCYFSRLGHRLEGQKRMKAFGTVNIPQEAFIEVLKA